MRIVCDGCAAKYSIADDKIRGKVFKIRCKKCSNVIVVRASAEVPEQVSADPDAIWHLVLDGEQIGPLTVGDVGARIAAGEANAETFGWCEGFAEWAPLAQVETFAALFAVADVPVRAVDTAPLAPLAPLPALPALPALDDDRAKLRGERNESSVLFSLNNLAKIASSTSAPRSSPATTATSSSGGEGSGLIDIRSMASAYLGGASAASKKRASTSGSVVGSFDDLPVFATSVFSEPGALVPLPAQRSRGSVMYVMVGAVGVLAAVAIVLVIMLMKSKPAQAQAIASAEPVIVAPKPTPPSEAPITASSVETPRTPPPIATPLDRVAETMAPPIAHHESKVPRAHANGAKNVAQAPPVASPQAKEAHDCDEVFCVVNPETPCCHAHAPKAAPSPKQLDSSLPEKLISSMIGSSLSPIRAKAMACGSTSSAKGKVRVHVKVGGDGRVSDVTVEASPDPALGTCVGAAVRRATFPKTQTGGSFAVPYVF